MTIASLFIASLFGCARADATPPIDRAKLKISLQRTACFGACPDYLVTIDGDGNVVFETAPAVEVDDAKVHQMMASDSGVLFPGRHVDRIDQKAVDDLVEQFRKAQFFELKDEYSFPVTDNPTYILTLDTGNGVKRLIDYVGEKAGMPRSITGLEKAVDRAAGTARWVRGTADLLPWLDERHFDYRSDVAVALAVLGANRHAEDMMIVGMINRGLPLDQPFAMMEQPPSPAGTMITEAALKNGLPRTLDLLAAKGWLDKLGRDAAARIFADNGAACSAELVDSAIRWKIPIDAPGSVERTKDGRPLTYSELRETFGAAGDTALSELSSTWRCDGDERKAVAIATKLLEKGADPNRRNALGETAIFNLENVALLDLLYAHGADGTVKDFSGNSAAFSSWSDEIVLRHLQHGASPVGKDSDGKTLQEQMKDHPMPKVAKWLADHGRGVAGYREGMK